MTEPNALPPHPLTAENAKLQAENDALRKLIPLVDEVMCEHANDNEDNYRACDRNQCDWCLQASIAINEATKARIAQSGD